jgi:Na+-translocating ferredoxin:NAD+ oxidoreductase subunit D
MIALLPIIIFAIYKNGFIPYQMGYVSFMGVLRPLFIIIIAMVTSMVSEMLFVRFILKIKGKELVSYMKHSYSLFPGLFLALILPINTPIWLIMLGSFFATIVGKMLFGGFGYNIFNPALIGALFVTSSYGALIASRGGYLNGLEIDTVTKATPLTNLSNLNYMGTWDTVVAEFGTLWDYFLGFIPGAIGETSKILILMAMIYLIFAKVIKWPIPITYISTVFIMTLIIGLYNDMGIWFPTFHVFSGGLMFGAVFMATDPVTSPVTKMGQVMFGLGLGLLTVIFRFLTPYPEGVLTAILTMNMMVFVLDRFGAKSKFDFRRIFIPIGSLLILIVVMGLYIGHNIKPKTGPIIDDRVKIISIKEQNNRVIYNATSKGFKGLIKADIVLENGLIIDIRITEQYESYWQEIDNVKYIDSLIKGQGNIKDVDTISGVTVTSQALKIMVIRVLEHYEENR